MNTIARVASSRRRALAQWLNYLPLPLLEAALVVSWSSGFIGARFSIDHASPMLVVFWRCVLVTLILLPFVARSLRRASPAVLLENASIGLLAMAGYLYGVVQGIALGVPAGLAALLADLLPIGMALLTTLVLRQRLGRRVWLGLAVGLSGVLLVTWDALAWGGAPPWAYGLPLLGMLSLAIATLWKRQRGAAANALGLLPNLWLQCGISGIAFAFVAGSEGSLLPVVNSGFALSVLWTAGLATLGGYGLYWVCVNRSSPTRVASVLYLSPGVTLLWAWVMFDEPLSAWMVLGTAVSAVGIGLVVRGESR
ncbi:DMT family transporter [Pseudomonas sp. PS1]|uniref:DMT family transporter n=1 Tax=Stutzerimonas marianensis TaxID=2929513 RepID=A0A9X1W172_9GAMM|nr:DMT family transporter [Pseudomonas marianensis]MCJ0972991.1 DMT family transporter [Pseudomonas marianensis]